MSSIRETAARLARATESVSIEPVHVLLALIEREVSIRTALEAAGVSGRDVRRSLPSSSAFRDDKMIDVPPVDPVFSSAADGFLAHQRPIEVLRALLNDRVDPLGGIDAERVIQLVESYRPSDDPVPLPLVPPPSVGTEDNIKGLSDAVAEEALDPGGDRLDIVEVDPSTPPNDARRRLDADCDPRRKAPLNGATPFEETDPFEEIDPFGAPLSRFGMMPPSEGLALIERGALARLYRDGQLQAECSSFDALAVLRACDARFVRIILPEA